MRAVTGAATAGRGRAAARAAGREELLQYSAYIYLRRSVLIAISMASLDLVERDPLLPCRARATVTIHSLALAHSMDPTAVLPTAVPFGSGTSHMHGLPPVSVRSISSVSDRNSRDGSATHTCHRPVAIALAMRTHGALARSLWPVDNATLLLSQNTTCVTSFPRNTAVADFERTIAGAGEGATLFASATE